jgi:predicted NACHT family NTPase
MAVTRFVSEEGLKIFEQARIANGLNKTVGGKESPWFKLGIGKSTLDRFRKRKAIKHENFIAICKAAGIDDWEKIADRSEIIQTKSNLSIDRSTSTELDVFSQQIFDWFKSLGFQSEGSPKPEGNYVEWVIQVPVRRSRFDRVLIRATIHEAGLSDLDSLRRGVAQLRVDEGWLVTNLWVSQSVRQALVKSDDTHLTCLTFDELIDQDADFTPYLDWLEREISKREIDRYYVDLGCTKGEFDADTRTLRGTSKYSVADGGIDRYIDRWLENPVTEHVSILGEFGTGKTWFAFHYAGKCLQAYRAAKSKGMPRPRLPLVIPLRDYAKALDVENVFAGFFYTQHNIRLNSEVFDRLNQMGKLLLIFDGFDEMADKIDTQKMTDNFWELAKVVTTNAKVILTCRTEHFPTAQDGRENFGGERIPSNVNKIAVAPKFETLELMKFDDEQIRAVLSRRTNSATVELVMANSQLLDLLRRAVMAEFVLEALPEIEAGKPIDLARVYLYAVRHKMERDITTGRTFTSLADKLYFLCELAWEMLSEDKMSLNYRAFPDRLRVLFKDEVKEQKHLDHWHYDMMGQTMLIRNDDGDYSPAHRSLLEFFVAYKLAAELGLLADDFLEIAKDQSGIDEGLEPEFYTWSDYWRRDLDDKGERKLIAPLAGFKSESSDNLRNTFGKSPLTKVILDLLLPSLNLKVRSQELNQLLDLIKSTKAADISYLGGNAATVLVKLNSDALDYQELKDTNLAHADLVDAGLRGTNLSSANLENCLITRVFGSVNAIIMSKDDRYFITAHDDKTIRVWDRVSGIELQNLIRHKGVITCLALNEDKQLIYSGSDDGTIQEWNLVDGTYQYTFEHQSSVRAISLSLDGQFLYSAGGNIIREWKVSDGICQRTFESHQNSVNVMALSRNGQSLYSGSRNGTIEEWRLSDGMCQRTFNGHQDKINAISLSVNGQFLYSSSGDFTIREWRIDNGICQRIFDNNESLMDVIVLSKNGELLYSGSRNGTIEEWKLADGSCRKTVEGHQYSVNCLVVSSDGQFLYAGGSDFVHKNGTIQEWEIANGRYQRTFRSYQYTMNAIALSRDRQLLYAGSSNGTIQEWKLSTGKCQRTFKGHQYSVNCLALSGDGQFLYSGSYERNIKEWRIADGKCQRTFEGHKDSVKLITLSDNGRSLYSASGNFMSSGVEIKEWELANGICWDTFEYYGNGIWGSVIALYEDEHEQRLYIANNDIVIKKLQKIVQQNSLYTKDSENLPIAISLSVDEDLLYSSNKDGMIKEWDVTTGECLRTIDYRLCAGANITNVKGLTPAQTDALLALGAFSDN